MDLRNHRAGCRVSFVMPLWRQDHQLDTKESAVNIDEIQGKWKQLRGKAQEKWGEITGDEWNRIDGKRDQIVGLVQEKYGHAKAEAEREVDDWLRNV